MELCWFVEMVYLPSRIEVCDQYAAFLARAVEGLSAHLGRPATLDDLTEINVCAHLSAYRRQWSARATNNRRQALLTLWLAAWEDGLLPAPPRLKRIRRLPEEIDPPEAWTADQTSALMFEAAHQHGTVCGIQAGDWWLSLLLTIYFTSCRISSMLVVCSLAYDKAGILVRRQKNHRPQWFPLPPVCRWAIDRTNPHDRKLLWPFPWHPRTVWDKMRKIVETAGLPCPRTGRQLFHRLRRTTLTLCAAVDPAIAQRTAGHQNYATTIKSYIDPRLLGGVSAADVLPNPLAHWPVLRVVS